MLLYLTDVKEGGETVFPNTTPKASWLASQSCFQLSSRTVGLLPAHTSTAAAGLPEAVQLEHVRTAGLGSQSKPGRCFALLLPVNQWGHGAPQSAHGMPSAVR